MKNSTTNTTSVRFTINFIDKQIIGTKSSFNKASKGTGAEYEELAAKMAKHPEFKLVVKEPKHKSQKAKRTYNGLTENFIKTYITALETATIDMIEYKEAVKFAEDNKFKVYPFVKSWFLSKYGTEEKPFDMDEAREVISNYRMAIVKANATAVANNITDFSAIAAVEQIAEAVNH